ncbi:hypothetical protein JL721_11431 [Aureococcus anophagefferens]|nr:hypothetical protein JL721_11431 [Aureococcus anophagefferens]
MQPDAGLDAAHPRYGAAAALLSGGLRHARSKPPHGDDAAGVARAVTIDGEACVVTERCGRASEASARWGLAARSPRSAGPGPARPSRRSRDGRFVFKQEDRPLLAALEGGLAEAYAQRAAARVAPAAARRRVYRRTGRRDDALARDAASPAARRLRRRRDKYDVKGSTAGRRTRPKSGTLKDLDALDDADALRVRGSERVLAALEADTALLADLGLLDYSLLLGVMETPTRGPLRPLRRVLGAPFRGTPWTWAKKLEFLCRGALRLAYPPVPRRRPRGSFAGTSGAGRGGRRNVEPARSTSPAPSTSRGSYASTAPVTVRRPRGARLAGLPNKNFASTSVSRRRRRCAQSVGRARGPRAHAGFPRRRVATLEYEEKTMFEPGRDLVETTLDEPVRETIMRDLREVGAKLKLVILPRVSQEGVLDRLKEWDLWGLAVCLALSIVLSVSAPALRLRRGLRRRLGRRGHRDAQRPAAGRRISFFQSVCILGYSIFR